MSLSAEFEEEQAKDPDRRPDEALPLEPGLQQELEGTLGGDLRRVRVHVGDEAAARAAREGARAFTERQEIYFARGEYDPGSPEGRRLLLHELAHARQAENPGAAPAGREALEQEAEAAAEAALRGERPAIGQPAAGTERLRQAQKAPAAPVLVVHPVEIAPLPPQGSLTGAGFSIHYLYEVRGAGAEVSLLLRVPEGVSVAVRPLTDLREGGDYRVLDPGGSRARAVRVAVTPRGPAGGRLEITFTRGGGSHRVLFQLPAAARKA
jgi:hypothetical protein